MPDLIHDLIQDLIRDLIRELDGLRTHRIVLVGGKGGVGKTTIAATAALHFSQTRRTILFTTDPASNLQDLFGSDPGPAGEGGSLTIESIDGPALYRRFLDTNLESFLEIGDRGTYLAKDELRRLFELALPGVDELMSWMRIGELVEEVPDAVVVVDTAPTGHTLRMLGSADHFEQIARALETLQSKHRALVRQFTRRDVRDAIDAFIADFDEQASERRRMLADPAASAFIPVFLSEPWVIEQTLRLIGEVRDEKIDVPFAVLNRAVVEPDCRRDAGRLLNDAAARSALGSTRVVAAPRSCVPLDSADRIAQWSRARLYADAPAEGTTPVSVAMSVVAPIVFVAGKGGVGKTTSAAAIALQRALLNPGKRYVVISVDPAHSLRDVFAHEAPPPNLSVETIDTRERWRLFRDTLGEEIERAVEALAPRGMSVEYDSDAMRQLVEIAPPGADELFAVSRLADLINDPSVDGLIIDTAPTGHFLRLLDLPHTAGEWVREFIRLLLRYRELVPAGALGEELVRASRALKELDETLRSDRAAVVVVTRPERVVVAETERLIAELSRREMQVAGIVANYMTPESECPCDTLARRFEMAALSPLARPVTMVQRRDAPVTKLEELARLFSE